MKLIRITLSVVLTGTAVIAQVPQHLNYQGRVSVNGVNFTGTGQFKFALVDAGTPFGLQATADADVLAGTVTSINITDNGAGYSTPPLVTITGDGTGATAEAIVSLGQVSFIDVIHGGSGYTTPPTITIAPPPPQTIHSTYWSNNNTSFGGEEPTSAVSLPVQNGLYSVGLGNTSLANMAALPPTLFSSVSDVRLRVWFNDGTHGFQQLTPDQRLASAPYAMQARMAESVAPGSVTASALAPGAVLNHLHSNSVMFSASESDSALVSAGFSYVGKMTTPPLGWRTVSTIGAPSPRADFSSVWTGSEWIIWGGRDGGGTALGNGARYRPSTDTWLPVSSSNSPSPRSGSATVWTGTEMIVWSGNSPASGGGRYNPTTDTWTAIPAQGGVADGLSGEAAVWTGMEMLVCDYGATSSLEVARYSPTTGSWTIGNTAGRPSTRYSPKGVWTGSEFFVYGGETTDGFYTPLADGGRYNPVTDSWTGVSYSGQAVKDFTLIMLGVSPAVWGGKLSDSQSTVVNTGQLSTGGNFWGGIGTTSAPVGRTLHTAVWTGSDMIVWGGVGVSSSALNSGGIYNHGIHGWTATPASSAPPARYLHKAVWTGSEMLVFGGFDGTAAIAAPAAFRPYGSTLHIYQK